MFIVWGLYVTYALIVTYLHSGSHQRSCRRRRGGALAAAGAQPPDAAAAPNPPEFRSRAWYPLAAGPGRYFEPCFKLLMGAVGAAIEMRFAAACNVPPRFRWAPCWPLYTPDGHFDHTHMNNWQHALMYSALSVSGAVDLLGLGTVAWPDGTEQVCVCVFVDVCDAEQCVGKGATQRDLRLATLSAPLSWHPLLLTRP